MLQGLLKADMLAIAYDGKSAPSDDLIEAVATAVRTNETDPAFAALLTRLPDIGELFLEREPADPAALDKARKQVQSALAETLADDARRILDAPSPTPFNPGAEQAGIRALRTAMIALLAAKGGEDAGAPLGQLFQNAPNMTESLATLRALCTLGGAAKTDAVSAFEAKWSSNPLVMDKWFAVQAATGDASDVSRLIAHKDFDLGNPNRVRSVIAVFAMQNLAAFHAPDGSGHAVAADVIAQADQRNPALAARLLQSFEQWKKLAPKARASAKAALERLNKKGLSKNAADIVARALA